MGAIQSDLYNIGTTFDLTFLLYIYDVTYLFKIINFGAVFLCQK